MDVALRESSDMARIEGGVPGPVWLLIGPGAVAVAMAAENLIRQDWLGAAVFSGLVVSLTIGATSIVRAARKQP